MTDMYVSMKVELTFGAAFIINSRLWLYPLLFATAAIVVVVKEFYLRDKRLSLAVTWILASGIFGIVASIHEALYAPIWALLEKLQG